MTQSFASYDGTVLVYRCSGEEGRPLICLPGGPGRVPDYFGDLGGLDQKARRKLVFLELRGTGASAVPADPQTYRCDRMAEDVEALRMHLGLDQMDLLGHSAGGDLALMYAARYPERISRLILVSPGLSAAGVDVTDDEFLGRMERRSAEPWFADAKAALLASFEGDKSAGNTRRYRPFLYGRWDEAAQAHDAGRAAQQTPAVAAGYYAEGAMDPAETRSRLIKVTAPVLVLVGELDLSPTPEEAAEAAALFTAAEVIIQPGAAHFPWIDDPAWFAATLAAFLSPR
jgi:pimeloyl-ACP methyl ester carboxylesterase